MRDTSEHLSYEVNVRSRKDNSIRSYVRFGDIYFEIEFIDACFDKLVISIRRVDILRMEVEDMEKSC